MPMTENEKDMILKLCDLFDKLPTEQKYFILGYAQAEANHSKLQVS